MRNLVIAARRIQAARFGGVDNVFSNAQMGSGQMKQHCKLDRAGLATIRMAIDRLGLSAPAYDRILKVARTIPNLEESEQISAFHVVGAVNYRNLYREGWSG